MKNVPGPEEVAFYKLFDKDYDSNCAYAASILKDREEGESIVNAVFGKFWGDKETMGVGKLNSAYLRTSVKNLCLNHREKFGKETSSGPDAERVLDETMLQAEYKLEINFLLKKLKPKYRVVIELHYLQDLDIADIATQLNIAESTVYLRINKALAKMKED